MHRSSANGSQPIDYSDMNTTSIPLIGAIVLGLAAAIAFAFPVSAQVLDAGISLDTRATTTVDADTPVSTKGETQTTNARGFTILRSSLSAGTEEGTAPTSAVQVKSETDLSAYTTAALRADERIDAVSFAEDAVEVSYYEQGRLIGIFPVTMKARAKVASDGTVTVSYPWYRFLVASDDTNADVKAKLESRVAALRADATAETALTASAKAELMDEIRSSLTVAADASVQ